MLFPPNELVHVFELSANIWSATRSRLEAKLRPLSMTWPQFGAMLALVEHDGVTQRELGELLEIDRTTMSVICDSLEKRGWAERRPDESDRRAKRIRMTDAGSSALGDAQTVVWDAYAAIATVLTPDEIAVVVPKLERILAALKAIPHDTATSAETAGA